MAAAPETKLERLVITTGIYFLADIATRFEVHEIA